MLFCTWRQYSMIGAIALANPGSDLGNHARENAHRGRQPAFGPAGFSSRRSINLMSSMVRLFRISEVMVIPIIRNQDALREFIAKGISFSEAAQAINSRFNTSYSRSAARGRARRLGLGPDDRQQPSMPTKPAELREIVEARPSDFRTPALPWPTPVFKAIKPVKLRCVGIESRHLSLIELERGDCRYPYGGDEEGEAITFCGHPRRPGSSYCTPHFHLSRDPIVPG
jgi:GcrA cell cycle regulator